MSVIEVGAKIVVVEDAAQWDFERNRYYHERISHGEFDAWGKVEPEADGGTR